MSDTALMSPEFSIGNILSAPGARYRSAVVTDRVDDNSISIASLESLYASAKHEVKLYGHLARGWDGYDGEPFLPETILKSLLAIDLAYRQLKNRQVELLALIPGPASDGSIELELRSGNKKLMLTFDPAEDDVAVYKKDDLTSRETAIPFSTPNLERELDWLAS